MWISDDTTQNLTAQRHKISNDVMQLSSLGESQSYGGGGDVRKSLLTLLLLDLSSVDGDRRRSQRNFKFGH